MVLYVTHRMEEVFEMCDAVTVFRDGRHIRTHPTLDGLDHDTLVSEMVGREIEDVYGYRARQQGEVLMRLEGLAGRGVRAPVSLEIHRGEVLGLFGLVGAGRSELMRLVCGAERASAGQVVFAGEARRFASARAAIRAGIAMCPEDRKSQGIFPVASVADNLNISCRRFFRRWGVFRHVARETENARHYIRQLRIKTPGPRTPIANLSGGNQQKVVLAKWLATRPRVLMLDEPTRGVDVGAKFEIYRLIRQLAAEGTAIIMVSSELPEILGMADRIAIMAEGQLAAILPVAESTPERVMAHATGQHA